MKNLLIKEVRLASSPLTYFFLAASLMTLLPGYPILMGSFFMCLGLFHSFQNAREANDMLYTVLLPVKKNDFVKSKFIFAVFIQSVGFILCAVLTAIRMTALSAASPYVNNALMNATPVYLAFVLLIFTAFNVFFIGGYFRTAYKIGMPFLAFGIAALVLVTIAEILPHLPGLTFLHTPSGERLGIQFCILMIAVVIYAAVALIACKRAQWRFNSIDL